MGKGLKSAAIVTGILAGSGFVFYRFVLSDNARDGLKFASSAIAESYRVIKKTIDETLGIVMEESNIVSAVDRTERAWEKIGY